ncbi:MAG: zf-HC2 domain-containing protein, partial [Gemmatimonadales bacterium]
MSHLDEGTLHALLDGELDATELMQIEAHLGTCAACGSRLRDARNFLSEADRLVATVQFSGAAAGAPAPRSAAPPPRASAPPPPRASAPVTPPPPPPPPRREERPWEPENESPVLLIPDNPESAPFSRRWPLLLGVAATIAVAVGAGYMASHIGKSSSSALASAPRPVMQPAESQAVVSPAEGERALASTQRDSAEPDSPAVRAPAPVAAKSAPPAPKPARTLAAREVPPPAKEAPAGSKDTAEEADQSEEAATRAAEQEAIRLQATNALSQLDRERRVSRAATATARLDQATLERNQRAATAGAVAPAPPPPPPTLEQRAQVYLRIGLDEASRQLGGPVHVIEGMNPTFMGLAPGRVAAGADTSRPVVRVVYQDSQGRMIMLDQQRRSGQPAPPPSTGAWSLGDVTMGLHGDVPAETLRSLRS